MDPNHHSLSTNNAITSDATTGTDGTQRGAGCDRRRDRVQTERKPKADSSRVWGSSDPSQWVGKKVRSKKSGATYTIRNVFKNGRVELEKSWMTYSSDVRELEGGYEPCV